MQTEIRLPISLQYVEWVIILSFWHSVGIAVLDAAWLSGLDPSPDQPGFIAQLAVHLSVDPGVQSLNPSHAT